MAVSDPWSEAAMGACVPLAAGMSQRVHGFIRGTGFVGLRGLGYALLSPALANDIPCLHVTDASFTDGVASVLIANNVYATGVNPVTMPNLPYASGSFFTTNQANPPALGRVVASSVRVWYTGRAINESGTTYTLRDPFHSSVQGSDPGSGALDVASPFYYGSRRETRLENFDRVPVTVSDFAAYVKELDFSSATSQHMIGPIAAFATSILYPFSRGNSVFADPAGGSGFTFTLPSSAEIGVPTAGILITGVPGEPFAFEVMTHVEYAGPITASNAIPLEADPVGTQKVMNAANEAQSDLQSVTHAPFATRMARKLGEATAAIQEIAIPVANFALASAGAVAVGAATVRRVRGGVGAMRLREAA